MVGHLHGKLKTEVDPLKGRISRLGKKWFGHYPVEI